MYIGIYVCKCIAELRQIYAYCLRIFIASPSRLNRVISHALRAPFDIISRAKKNRALFE